ncbi:hypothetical protein SAMN05192530_11248 [Aureimonas jatrophae]|uniref:Uncharacterized protein n=1 Tax=Aureimonas jatrophae TaxID=1166073 RepID=A0A1H0M3E1_9HYPH|nr:hypothetical protein SAMN05192530_11248 [Aureimonas jatrophae]
MTAGIVGMGNGRPSVHSKGTFMTYRAWELDIDAGIDVEGHMLLRPEHLDDSYVVWSVFGNREYVQLTDIGPEDVRRAQDEEMEELDCIAAAED